jgi:hypothetical protein
MPLPKTLFGFCQRFRGPGAEPTFEIWGGKIEKKKLGVKF